ncbi:MAG: mandelate racemase/muconate lactonizing enzyme family protein [SAR202 cluster bacterium]|nr:mandelate racemase/muconate lactonizing enzyme family protein [SAR202 cluster bacterium]
MRIVSIQADQFRIPLPTVLSDSTHGQISHFELVTVRVRADEGVEGLGYTYTVGAGGASIRALIERELAPVMVGADPRRTEQLWEKMWWHIHWVGRGGLAVHAMSAMDIALWDVKGRAAIEPLWRLLGGHSPKVKAYAGGVDLYYTLDELRRQTHGFLERGLHAIKMKVGREKLSEDVERVEAVRKIVGPDFPLMVDANMRWTAAEAIRASRALAEHGLYWLEEPVIPEDIEGHVRIAREGALPIAAGENLHTIPEFQRLITSGGVSFPEPDVSNIGGITAWMKVAHLAEAHNLPVTSHGVHDIHVSLLAAVPNASYLELHGFGLERFLKQPLKLVDGEAVAPDRSGLGVEFDWEKLAQYQVRA